MDKLVNIELAIKAKKDGINDRYEAIRKDQGHVSKQQFKLLFFWIGMIFGAAMVLTGLILVFDIYRLATDSPSILFQKLRIAVNGWFWAGLIMITLMGWGYGIAESMLEKIKKCNGKIDDARRSIKYSHSAIERMQIEMKGYEMEKQTFNKIGGMADYLD